MDENIKYYNSDFFYLKRKSKKMIDTENYIDTYISSFGAPPTYRQIMKRFNLSSVNSAYHRVKHCRNKMKKRN